MESDIESRIQLFLAGLWSVPPWEPWIEYYRLKNKEGQNTSILSPDDILDAIKSRLQEKGIDPMCVDKFTTEYESLTRDFSNDNDNSILIKHSLLIPVLVETLLSCNDSGLSELANVVRGARNLITNVDERVVKALRLASAFDRLVEKTIVKTDISDPKLVLVSPFNPIRVNPIEMPESIDYDKVSEYIVEYALELVGMVKKAKTESRIKVLRDAAFLLLEPLWHVIFNSESDRIIVPPASIYYPAYTVFDKINATLAALNWTIDANNNKGDWRPNGYIAIIDLAGVQSWIRESRRLRDLWASSWLASLLAWKAVEQLVDEYGPGVLVQPPARLHPFLAARLAGSLQDPGGSALQLLGLAKGWPIDATVPTRYLVALPPSMDHSKLKFMVRDAIKNTWQDILDSVSNILEIIVKILRDENINSIDAGVPRELIDYMREVEPPLAARIYIASVSEAYNKALQDSQKKPLSDHSNKFSPNEFADVLFYSYALGMLHEQAAVTGLLKVPGRRVGKEYYCYVVKARQVYSTSACGKSGKSSAAPVCTVCGAAPALVDGTRLVKYSKILARKIREEYNRVDDGTILLRIAEVFDEKLCPYCLTKRLMRTLLQKNNSDLARRLVGLPLSDKARELLDFNTIDALTSRLVLNKNRASNLAKDLARALSNIGYDTDYVISMLPEELLTPALVGNSLEPYRSSRDSDVFNQLAESIVLEILHDEHRRRQALERLGKTQEDKAEKEISTLKQVLEKAGEISRSTRAKTSLLLMDGDMLGKGVLAGRLGISPISYIKAIIEAAGLCADPDNLWYFGDLAIASYEALSYQEKAERGNGGCRYCGTSGGVASTVVTLLYHFSVSRALAVQSYIDRSIIEEKNGGILVYAGGDDLLAVLPPVGCENEDCSRFMFRVVDAALAARRSYWGLEKDYNIRPGFNIIRANWLRSSAAIAVAPSLAAHGRSGVIYIFNSSYPLWLALSHAWSLEEDKDTFTQALTRGNNIQPVHGTCKDVLVIYNDSTGAALLPLRLGGITDLGLVAESLQDATTLALATVRHNIDGRNQTERILSPGFYTEIITNAHFITETAGKAPELAAKLVESILTRNLQKHRNTIMDVNRLVEIAKKYNYHSTVVASMGEASRNLPTSFEYKLDETCTVKGAPLFLQIVLASRALHYSK